MKRTLLISFAFSAAFLSTTAAQGQVDPKALVSESIRNYQRDWQAIRTNWASTESDITEADGTKQANVSEVIPVAGTPYDRLILKNGHPLTPAEQRREDRKFERALRQREQEAPSEREARIRKYDQERALVTDIPNAYSFKLLGEELVDGRPAWILAMTPRPDFTPSTPHGSLLGHVEGKLWIDEGDVRWVKAEAHVIDTIGIGWVLARIEPGAQFTLEQTRVENELWVPRRITIAGAARVMIFHSKSISEELTWSGYRKDGGVSADKRDSVNSGARSLSKSFR